MEHKFASPWLNNRIKSRWRGSDRREWAHADCLADHFDIPVDAKRIRFVKGKTSESLRVVFDDAYTHYSTVTYHRDRRLNGSIYMLSAFREWFTSTPGSFIWIEVETA